MQINNYWISGFVDGDGCFSMQKILLKNNKIVIKHKFIVSIDKTSVYVLYALKSKLKCGNVYKSGKNMCEFVVSDKHSLLNIIIPFFIKYPLQTEKRKDFYKFVESINETLNFSIYHDFIFTEMKKFQINLNDEWVAGFIDAEACFYVSIVDNYPRPKLFIENSNKNLELLNQLKIYLQCGHVITCKNNFSMFTVSNISQFTKFIFPKLYTKTGKNLLKTIKRINFQKFRKIVLSIAEKKHLTLQQMKKIQLLKNSMNKIIISK